MALNEVMVQYWRSVCSVASLFVCRTCEYLLFQVFDFLHRFYFPMLSGSLHWRHVPVVLWAFCLPIGPRANRSVDRDQAVFVINVQSAAIFTRALPIILTSSSTIFHEDVSHLFGYLRKWCQRHTFSLLVQISVKSKWTLSWVSLCNKEPSEDADLRVFSNILMFSDLSN